MPKPSFPRYHLSLRFIYGLNTSTLFFPSLPSLVTDSSILLFFISTFNKAGRSLVLSCKSADASSQVQVHVIYMHQNSLFKIQSKHPARRILHPDSQGVAQTTVDHPVDKILVPFRPSSIQLAFILHPPIRMLQRTLPLQMEPRSLSRILHPNNSLTHQRLRTPYQPLDCIRRSHHSSHHYHPHLLLFLLFFRYSRPHPFVSLTTRTRVTYPPSHGAISVPLHTLLFVDGWFRGASRVMSQTRMIKVGMIRPETKPLPSTHPVEI